MGSDKVRHFTIGRVGSIVLLSVAVGLLMTCGADSPQVGDSFNAIDNSRIAHDYEESIPFEVIEREYHVSFKPEEEDQITSLVLYQIESFLPPYGKVRIFGIDETGTIIYSQIGKP